MLNLLKQIIKELRKKYLYFTGELMLRIYKNSVLKTPRDRRILKETWNKENVSCVLDMPEKEIQSSDVMLSMILPLYNSEVYIDKCIYSMINQNTQYKYECILIDDGSTDESLKLALMYQQRYPEKIRCYHQENLGISAARNKGIECAKGIYIGFIDHDDWVTEEYVERLISTAIKEEADVVKCGFAEMQNGVIVNREQSEDEVIKGNMEEKLLKYKSYIWGGVYKSKLFECVRFPIGYWYEDMITRMLIYRQSNTFINIGETLYYKLVHKNNASTVIWSNKSNKCLEQLYLIEMLCDDNSKLHLNEDVSFYRTILREVSDIMVGRIKGLKSNVQKQVFLAAREICLKYYKREYEETFTEKECMWNDAILDKKFNCWKALSRL